MSGWRKRLDEIGERHDLDGERRERLGRLLELLRDDPAAPTTVRDPAEAVDVHVADSLIALELEVVRTARRVADVGAGAGFPGLPLAVALPGAQISLVESASRKCAFLERGIAAAGALNAEVACVRVEEWPVRDLDLVCVRAVAPLAVLVEYAAPISPAPTSSCRGCPGRRRACVTRSATCASASPSRCSTARRRWAR